MTHHTHEPDIPDSVSDLPLPVLINWGVSHQPCEHGGGMTGFVTVTVVLRAPGAPDNESGPTPGMPLSFTAALPDLLGLTKDLIDIAHCEVETEWLSMTDGDE